VYAAFDTVDALEVAWNKLHVDRLNAAERSKIMNEVGLLGQIHHKNIIRLYASFRCRDPDADADDSIAFITEQMMSGTLKEFLKKAQIVKLKVIRKWCNNILEAIAYLHERRIMHRDMKLDNLFINGHVGEVKIGDLGLSAVRDTEHPAESVIGTPEFMAPELYEESYTEKVDVYAFGMCLLEMVTMEYPYSECHGPAQIMMKVFNNEKPASFHRLIDCDVKDVIAQCLQREPHRPSAAELLQHPLFRDWESDDGKRSNLSLMASSDPNQELPGDSGGDQTPYGAFENAPTIAFSEQLNRDVLVETREASNMSDGSADPGVSVQPTHVGAGFSLNLQWPIADGLKLVTFTFNPGDRAEDLAREMLEEFDLAPSQLAMLTEEIESKVNDMKEQQERLVRNSQQLYDVSGVERLDSRQASDVHDADTAVAVVAASPPAVDGGEDAVERAYEIPNGGVDALSGTAVVARSDDEGTMGRPNDVNGLLPRPASVPPQILMSVARGVEDRPMPQQELVHSRSLSPPELDEIGSSRPSVDPRSSEQPTGSDVAAAAQDPVGDDRYSGVDARVVDDVPSIELPSVNMGMNQHPVTAAEPPTNADAGMSDYEQAVRPLSQFPSQELLQPQPPRPAPAAREIVVVRDESKSGGDRATASSRASSRPVSFSGLSKDRGPMSRSTSDDGVVKGPDHAAASAHQSDTRLQSLANAARINTPILPPASAALPPPVPVSLPAAVVHDDAAAGHAQPTEAALHQLPHVPSLGLQSHGYGTSSTPVSASTLSNLGVRTNSFRSVQSDDSVGMSSHLVSPTQSIATPAAAPSQATVPRLGAAASANALAGTMPNPSGIGGDPDYNQKWYTMCLELMHNASRGRFALVKQKLAQGVSPNFADYDKRTALHLAAAAGSLATVNVLIDAGADVNAQDRWGGTAIRDALAANHVEVVLRLEEAGATRQDDTEGFDAADKPSIELVQFSSDGNLAAVKERVSSGVPVNVCDYDQRTPLHLACSQGHADVVDFLLLNGANAVAKDRMGRTPVENAVKNGHRHVLEVLKRSAHSDAPLLALLTELRAPATAGTPNAAPTVSGPPASPMAQQSAAAAAWPASDGKAVNGNGHGAFGSSRPKSTPNAEQLERMRTEAAISHSISMGHIGIASDDFAGSSNGAAGHYVGNDGREHFASASSQSLPPTPYEAQIASDSVDLEHARLLKEYERERNRLDAEHRAKIEGLRRKKTANLNRNAHDYHGASSVSPQSGVPASSVGALPRSGTPAYMSSSSSPAIAVEDLSPDDYSAAAAVGGHPPRLRMSQMTLPVAAVDAGMGQLSSMPQSPAPEPAPSVHAQPQIGGPSSISSIDVQVPLFDGDGVNFKRLSEGETSLPVAIVEGIVEDASRGGGAPFATRGADHRQ
jgi:serine/threonine protein kinase/ankyrin repeat protein